MVRTFCMFWRDDKGATAVEYSLIASLLSISCVLAITAYGESIQDVFMSLSGSVDSANAAAVVYTGQGTGTP
jgi:Flp pilus assembly pilin Flp